MHSAAIYTRPRSAVAACAVSHLPWHQAKPGRKIMPQANEVLLPNIATRVAAFSTPIKFRAAIARSIDKESAARRFWRCRSGGKYYGPRGAARN